MNFFVKNAFMTSLKHSIPETPGKEKPFPPKDLQPDR